MKKIILLSIALLLSVLSVNAQEEKMSSPFSGSVELKCAGFVCNCERLEA